MTVEFIDVDGTATTFDHDKEAATNGKSEKGICKVCGKPARSLTGTVCDEHDGRRTRGSSGSSTGRRSSSTGKPPTATEWTNKVFAKLLVALTFFMAIRMINNKGIRDPDDEIATRLSMTTDEAKAIASPIGRFIAPTKLAKSYGRHVVDNVDIVDAFLAFFDWYQRVNKFLASSPHLAQVYDMPNREEQEEGNANEPINSENESVGYGWDGGNEFVGGDSGAQFI